MTTTKVLEKKPVTFPCHYKNTNTGTVLLMIRKDIGIIVSTTDKGTGVLDQVFTGINLTHPAWEPCPSVTTFEC